MPTVLFKSILYTLALLLTIEGVLEYRGYKRGFTTLFFGTQVKLYDTSNGKLGLKKMNFGPNDIFPFRSQIIEHQARNDNTLRLWLASASYAEAIDRPVAESFANLTCSVLIEKGTSCQMLNASKAGWQITQNIEQILAEGKMWQPDYILLYQLSNDAKVLIQAHYKQDPSDHVLNNGIFDTIGNKLKHLLERTNLYVHTREYIGGFILMSSQLNQEIPSSVYTEFRERLESFIAATRAVGARPVLMTFLGRNSIETIDKMPLDLKFQLLKFTSLVSAETWPVITFELNSIIRNVAVDNNVLLIDLDVRSLQKPSYFKDYFHFTKAGHLAVARVIAREISNIVVETKTSGF